MNQVTRLSVLGLAWIAVSCRDEGVLYLSHGTEELAGSRCPNGGQRLDYGPDGDADGVLEGPEITGTAYICNGSASRAPLFTNTALARGDANCPNGGFALAMGNDQNANDQLDESEALIRYVCNGTNAARRQDAGSLTPGAPGAIGAPGAPGAIGTDGHDVIFTASRVLPAEECPFGGQRFVFGTDANDSGGLDGTEAAAPVLMCSGTCGTYTCGGSCGTCESNKTCTEGVCACVPNSCGGSCGACGGDERCGDAGTCLSCPSAACTVDAECCASAPQCAGGLSPTKTCQDCNAPLTASGAYCQNVPGNQCCNGQPGAFVGVKVEDQSLVCLTTGTCRPAETPCTLDSDCGGGLLCMRGAAICGCTGATPTFCGTVAPLL